MKNRSLIPLVLATVAGTLWPDVAPHVASAADARQAVVSFTVYKLEEESAEGPSPVRNYFMIGDKRMVFGVPKGYRIATGDEFVLTPAEPGMEGEIHVRRSPFAPELDLVDSAAKYRDAVVGQIPQGAKDTDVQPPQMDPFPFNGWKSLGFVCTYTFYGRSLRRMVSYVNVEGAQVVVVTEGPPTSADKLDKDARSFIGSWWASKAAGGK